MPADDERPLAEIVGDILGGARTELIQTWPAARDDDPDGVHQHRVRVRRLRSVLGGFRHVLDPSVARMLRVRYDEWGHELGVVRDLEVLAELGEGALQACDIDDADVRRRVVEQHRDECRRAHGRLLELAVHPRADERRRLLDEAAEHPLLADPTASARDTLAGVLGHEARRVRRAAKGVDGSLDAFHVLRKAGRRLRYNAEAIAAVAPELFGDELDGLAAGGDDIHDMLGDHRDGLILTRSLEIARAQARRAGEPAAAYDVLIAHVHREAERSLEGLDDVVRRVRRAAAELPG